MAARADVDPRTLRPGTKMQHVMGGLVTLARRKDDDSGWWNTDGSGLTDSVFNDGSWRVMSAGPTEAGAQEQMRLNWLAASFDKQFGPLPLYVRFVAARAALAVIEDWRKKPTGSPPSADVG